jgi:hypothetical protein
MRPTARVTDAPGGHTNAVAYMGSADALLGAGTASVATVTSPPLAPAPAPAQATTVRATTLGAAAQRAVNDAAAEANQRKCAPDHKVAGQMTAARRGDADRRAGLTRTRMARAEPTRTGLVNITRQRARPRPELRRPRP